MKSEKEIEERFKDVERAWKDLLDHSNFEEAEKLAIQMDTLGWMLE